MGNLFGGKGLTVIETEKRIELKEFIKAKNRWAESMQYKEVCNE